MFVYRRIREGILGFPAVPNMSAAYWEKPQTIRLEQLRFICSVLRNSCVKCYVVVQTMLKTLEMRNKHCQLTEKIWKYTLVRKSQNCHCCMFVCCSLGMGLVSRDTLFTNKQWRPKLVTNAGRCDWCIRHAGRHRGSLIACCTTIRHFINITTAYRGDTFKLKKLVPSI